MILVISGTHEQPFNRLLNYMNDWACGNTEQVVMQTGFTGGVYPHCLCQRFYEQEYLNELIRKARIVITHGGSSSVMSILQAGKTPVVVPRQHKYGEHVNDHQVNFCMKYTNDTNSTIAVLDINTLGGVIAHYDEICAKKARPEESNNKAFCERFTSVAEALLASAEKS